MALEPISAIAAMVTPVVLITTGGILAAGFLNIYGGIADRMLRLTQERVGILRGPSGQLLDVADLPPADHERLTEIDRQIPSVLRHFRRLRDAAAVVFSGIGLLALSVIAIAIAVSAGSMTFAYVALGFVVAGTVALFGGVAIGTSLLLRSADMVEYTARRARELG